MGARSNVWKESTKKYSELSLGETLCHHSLEADFPVGIYPLRAVLVEDKLMPSYRPARGNRRSLFLSMQHFHNATWVSECLSAV